MSYVFLSKFKKINRQLPLFFPLVLNSKTIKVHYDKSSVVLFLVSVNDLFYVLLNIDLFPTSLMYVGMEDKINTV